MDVINVIIIDDHQISALGIQVMVQQDENIKVMGIFNSGREALQFVHENKPDVVLLDMMMPEMDGFEILQGLRLIYDDIKAIFLTISDTKESFIKALALNANGFIFKDVNKDEIINSIKKVHNNEYAYSHRIFDALIVDIIRIFSNPNFQNSSQNLKLYDNNNHNENNNLNINEIESLLTQREYEIFILIGDDMSTQEISEKLNLSKFTVNAYRKNILAKLNTKNIKSLFHKLEIGLNYKIQ
jgi:DNA-binding NarL/FixJ family response regulator